MNEAVPSLAPDKLFALRANIFENAHGAIEDWDEFPWHRDQRNEVQADKVHSSQALTIDVFGAIKTSKAKDAILDALADLVGLPPGGPWSLHLEWTDDQRLLREPRATQVDVLAVGTSAILVIECKFTEPGGSCSQTQKLRKGPGAGMSQCNGRYEMQVNPRSETAARCALSGKGIRYWDVIPALFDLSPDAVYAPCPFKGEAFQWMRNMALAHELGRTHGKEAACVITYAAGGGFPTESKVGKTDWLPEIAHGASLPGMISYQQIVQLAAAVDYDPRWDRLGQWVNRKVKAAVNR